MSTEKTKAVPKSTRRWRLLGGLLAVLATVGAVYGTYWAQVLRLSSANEAWAVDLELGPSTCAPSC